MYNIALALAKRTSPALPIELIAYGNTLTVPGEELPVSNRIVTMLCPSRRPYERRFYELGGPRLGMSTAYPEPDRLNPVDDRDYGKLFRAWLGHKASRKDFPGSANMAESSGMTRPSVLNASVSYTTPRRNCALTRSSGTATMACATSPTRRSS